MTEKKEKRGRPKGSTKKKLSPEAQRLADLKGKKAKAAADRSRAAGGLLGNALELGFEARAKSQGAHWKLQADERAMLKEANDGLVRETGLKALEDPWIFALITYALVLAPRVLMDLAAYNEKKRKKPADDKPQRPAESDNHSVREKGARENNSDLEGISPPTADKAPLNL